ncbi:hypothetical protein TBLA_0A00910 [Henningerozyma blattae CBS 6284]|uniref:Glycoside hydrolase family 5 domain-containing protein n=1 Tax=Henningerozyma blattae (strain ATCC 34711 / CBS 6284 / DSM 70876 / NBRC 10599 / NRRL Y-10934 / UCD 77-7) TaxID=1071380 RepID=I2GUT9_HENB6|nr:hypothetical protein TBLA_0A00910 [Tetrapisispora blattae CBS 6284]CCH57891.1 hypothetical protein TBLA_0A00910 [Tetrapisispora blattae CBS 6284]
MPCERLLLTEDGQFRDNNGNIVILRGINFDSSIKNPTYPKNTNSHSLIGDENTFFSNAFDNISFVNHPFPLHETSSHINRLKSLGYNVIRYPFTWEALEHEGPGVYDYKYMDYAISLMKKINKIGGIYIFLDPHQDVWSRFTGGSGAPLWTLYAAGFQPTRFQETEAAILHNHYIDPKTKKEFSNKRFPKMLWPTNYTRLACQTMFTLFFAGKQFAPKCIINDMNIQDYLQQTFLNAILTFYLRIKEQAPELFTDNCLIGLETMNEPSKGYLGEKYLNIVPKDRDLKLDSTPSALQSFLLGEGNSCTVDKYEISVFGPAKNKTKIVDPKGSKAWLSEDERFEIDKAMGWQRGPGWEPDMCIWRMHDVWKLNDDGSGTILLPDYFVKDPKDSSIIIDEKYFINHHFIDYYQRIHEQFRAIDEWSFIILQPPVMKEPPKLKDNTKLMDGKIILACHFYDGMSLMFKTWNTRYNVDTFGIVRGKYSNPAFSLVLGEANIRKSIRKQLREMFLEAKEHLGPGVPVIFTETGMPMDMDNKQAYEDGKYASQTAALDAIHYALEGSNLSYCLWCYCAENSHEWGDNWNNEDFSIWSNDDVKNKSKYEKILKTVPKTKQELKNEKKRQQKLIAYQKAEQKARLKREENAPLPNKRPSAVTSTPTTGTTTASNTDVQSVPTPLSTTTNVSEETKNIKPSKLNNPNSFLDNKEAAKEVESRTLINEGKEELKRESTLKESIEAFDRINSKHISSIQSEEPSLLQVRPYKTRSHSATILKTGSTPIPPGMPKRPVTRIRSKSHPTSKGIIHHRDTVPQKVSEFPKYATKRDTREIVAHYSEKSPVLNLFPDNQKKKTNPANIPNEIQKAIEKAKANQERKSHIKAATKPTKNKSLESPENHKQTKESKGPMNDKKSKNDKFLKNDKQLIKDKELNLQGDAQKKDTGMVLDANNLAKEANTSATTSKKPDGVNIWTAVAAADEKKEQLEGKVQNQETTELSHTTHDESTVSLSANSVASIMDKPNISTIKSNSIPVDHRLGLKYPPCNKVKDVDLVGFRALDAILRPFVIKIHGSFKYAEFDLLTKTYVLEICGSEDIKANPLPFSRSPTPLSRTPSRSQSKGSLMSGVSTPSISILHAPAPSKELVSRQSPTYIYLPKYHFPYEDMMIQAPGYFSYDPTYQILKWYHYKGLQTIRVSVLFKDLPSSSNTNCTVM